MVKCTVISDTHNKHDQLKLSGGDVLLHCGDATMLGQPNEVYPFLEWLAKQPYEYKIFIAGNHDIGWEPIGSYMLPNEPYMFRGYHELEKGFDIAYKSVAADLGLVYLHNESVEIEGIKMYGTPETQLISIENVWAFNYNADTTGRWNHIPRDTNILISHGPPLGIMDEAAYGGRCGSNGLRSRVEEIKPKYHLFGHIHEGYGRIKQHGTKYINAASMNREYRIMNKPINFTY